MSRRRQGRAKGGRAARHHEAQGSALPPLPRRRHRNSSGLDLDPLYKSAVEIELGHIERRQEMAALGFVEERLSPEEMFTELGIDPDGKPRA